MSNLHNKILEKVCSVELLCNSTLGTFFDKLSGGVKPPLFYYIISKSHIINGIVAMDSKVVIAKSSAA